MDVNWSPQEVVFSRVPPSAQTEGGWIRVANDCIISKERLAGDGFGKSWALLRIFGLRTQPGSRQGIRYYLPLYGQEAHWHAYTQPLLLRCLYSTQEPVCMKQDRNAIEMCDQSKYRKERRLVYKRSSQEKKKIRRFWECSLKRCRNRKWVVSTLIK